MAWFDDYFEDDYLLLEEPTDLETLGHIAFLRSVLPAAGASVLDLGCGSGRLSLALARLGYSVTALDFKPWLLRLARNAAAKANQSVEFVCQDMRTMDFKGRFHFVLSFRHTFGYFRDEENSQTLAAISRALKPGGKLLLDLANRDSLIRQLDHHRRCGEIKAGHYVRYRRDLDPLTGRLDSKITIFPEVGLARHYQTSVRYYTYTEIKTLLRQTGLRIREVYGGYDRTPCSLASPRLLILAKKQPDELHATN